jgi:hypothetical protein
MNLFATLPKPPSLLSRGIDLRNCDTAEMMASLADGCADLVVADPPWTYSTTLRDAFGDLNPAERAAGKPSIPRYTTGSPSDYYATMTTKQIADQVAQAHRIARRLALWLTWPLLGEWERSSRGWAWGPPVSGGAWVKSGEGDAGHYGPGFHWSGCSEPVFVYSQPKSHTDRTVPLRNAWVEPPREHSRKPTGWQAQMIRKWVPEGGLVVDVYAGLGSVAEAVIEAGGGRRYIGAELSEERHNQALSLLAQWRSR